MEEQERAILERVARGELSPEAGAAELDDIEAAEQVSADGGPDLWRVSVPVGGAIASTVPGLGSVRIRSDFGTVTVIGDNSVREAVAEGPHSVRREGDALVIEHSPIDQADQYVFGRHGYVGHRQRLIVRMNPSWPLDLESQAGSVQIRGLSGRIRAAVHAGSTTIEDFTGPLTLASQAGTIRARGILREGDSTISCQAGSVRLELGRGSNVRVRARAHMGRVHIDGVKRPASLAIGGSDELVVGDGRATLEIEATMGSIRVETAG